MKSVPPIQSAVCTTPSLQIFPGTQIRFSLPSCSPLFAFSSLRPSSCLPWLHPVDERPDNMGQSRATRLSFFSQFRRRKQKSDCAPSLTDDGPGPGNGSQPVVSSSMPKSPSPYSKSESLITAIEQTPEISIARIPTLPTTRNARDPSRLVPSVSTASSIHSVDQEADISRDLWVVAYHNLRVGEDTAKLMAVYEKILTDIYTQKNEAGM